VKGELAATTSAALLPPLPTAPRARPPPRKEAWRGGARIGHDGASWPRGAIAVREAWWHGVVTNPCAAWWRGARRDGRRKNQTRKPA
jgi:hypothetical protein